MSDTPDRIFAGPECQWNADPIEPCMVEYVIGTEHNQMRADHRAYDTVMRARIAELEHKIAALVEAVKKIEMLARMAHDHGVADTASDALILAQQDQPAGEWITISEGGSNLPEHVPDEELYPEWRVKCHSGKEKWVALPPRRWFFSADQRWLYKAYWSIPYIDRRPDIPAYTDR